MGIRRSTKVTLLQPANYEIGGPYTPLALLVLASALQKSGHEVRVADLNVAQLDPRDHADARVIGVTCMGGEEIFHAFDAIDQLRGAGIRAPVVWGGAQATMSPEIALQDSHVDGIVRGHGEKLFCEYVDNADSWKEWKSIWQIQPLWLSIDPTLYPLPYDLVPIERYGNEIGFPIQTMRGCTGNCSFCYITQWKQRPLSVLPAEIVVHEIEHIRDRFGVQRIWFIDDNFFFDKERVLYFCELALSRGISITWDAAARADELCCWSDVEFEYLKAAGCRSVSLGGESGSACELARMHKNMKPQDLYEAAALCAKHGIKYHYNWLLGYPHCTTDDLLATVTLVERMDAQFPAMTTHSLRFSVFTPWPGTPAYDEAVSLGFQPPRTLSEWAQYGFYDVTRLPFQSDQMKKLMKAVFYVDYYMHLLPFWPKKFYEKFDYPALLDYLCAFEKLFCNDSYRNCFVSEPMNCLHLSGSEVELLNILARRIGLPF